MNTSAPVTPSTPVTPFATGDRERLLKILFPNEDFDAQLQQQQISPRLDETTPAAEEQFDMSYIDKYNEVSQDDLKQDLVIREAFEKGIDLRDYANGIEKQLEVVEHDHVMDYLKNWPSLVELHSEIKDCDGILEQMESLLQGFQTELGKLSQEIQILQDQSQSMSLRLNNRLNCKKQVQNIVEGLLITPEIIQIIMATANETTAAAIAPVDEKFAEALLELNRKMGFVKSHRDKNVRAFKDIGPGMEALRLKASERIRTYFLEKVRSLGNAGANVAIIQQSVFLKNKQLYHFVLQRFGDVANEIRTNYVQTMSNYYHIRFTKYASKMQKLQYNLADKYDLIGLDDGAKKGLFGAGKVAVKDKNNVFALNDRLDVLLKIDSPVIVPHVAEEKDQKYQYESVFRSIERVLLDNSSSEYCFITEFFCPPRPQKKKPLPAGKVEYSPAQLAELQFQEIFGRTLKMITEQVRQYAEQSFDALGLLLCIRINQQHQVIMQKRQIPCLDTFLNGLNLIMWPRFQNIIDMHISSVRKSRESAGGVFSSSIDIHPHYVTRRFAEFAASVLALNDGYNDNLLDTSISRLRIEVEAFISKLSSEFADKKKKAIFYINQYDLVISIFEKYEQFSSVTSEKRYFDELLSSRISEYVDDEMRPYFTPLIVFVDEVQQKAESNPNLDNVDQVRFEKVAKDFASNWRSALAELHQNSLQNFSNFKIGSLILNEILKQVVGYYQMFTVYWDKKFPPNAKPAVQPVLLQQIVLEIKSKYKSNF